MLNINLKLEGIEQIRNIISPPKIDKAIKFAVNRTAQQGKTMVSSIIREKWNIAKQDLDRKISLKPYHSGQAEITLIGKPISLIYFEPKQQLGDIIYGAKRNKGVMPGLYAKKVKGRRVTQISVRILKDKRTVFNKRTFFIIGRGGTPLIVYRTPDKMLIKRAVITEVSMLKQRMKDIRDKIKTSFKKNWDNQVRQITRGTAGYLDDEK